jgi:endonuclease/exonuclease/phosphatase family metal-dependent hydrolase
LVHQETVFGKAATEDNVVDIVPLDATKPFHIDYCFLPKAWAERISLVEVETFQEWEGHSDHRPLFVEITGDGF